MVLRRDDEKPAGLAQLAAGAGAGEAADPTWEATLRRAATRALTWDGLTDAPFVASQHSKERAIAASVAARQRVSVPWAARERADADRRLGCARLSFS